MQLIQEKNSPETKCGATRVRSQNEKNPRFATLLIYFTKGLAFCFGCGNNSRISMLFELAGKSKGRLMSMQTRPVSTVLPTDLACPGADKSPPSEYILFRFTAAPTVANTSVSRQTGLAGIWNKSFDRASLTFQPNSGVTSTMRNNTLVACPKNFRAMPPISAQPLQLVRSSPRFAKVSP